MLGATRSRRRRHVDPVRVHLITLVVFGVIAGAVLAIWTFPKFFLGLLVLAASAIVYAKLYGFIEQRLEAEEGRLAKELGFAIDDDNDDQTELDLELEELANVRRRRAAGRRRRSARSGRAKPEAADPLADDLDDEVDDASAGENVPPTPSRVVESGAAAPAASAGSENGGSANPASSSSSGS